MRTFGLITMLHMVFGRVWSPRGSMGIRRRRDAGITTMRVQDVWEFWEYQGFMIQGTACRVVVRASAS